MDIVANVNELQNQVQPYSKGKIKQTSKVAIVMEKINIYVIIPIVILVLLIGLRPSFIKTTQSDGKRKLSVSKLITFWLIFSIVCILGYYGYSRKLK